MYDCTSHLRINWLREDGAHRVFMARETMDLDFRAHVPHSAHAVSPTRHEQVQRRVEGNGVNP